MRIQVITPRSRRQSPEEQVKDMLRYDEGVIISSEELKGERHKLIIEVKTYTRGRWTSFGLPSLEL